MDRVSLIDLVQCCTSAAFPTDLQIKKVCLPLQSPNIPVLDDLFTQLEVQCAIHGVLRSSSNGGYCFGTESSNELLKCGHFPLTFVEVRCHIHETGVFRPGWLDSIIISNSIRGKKLATVNCPTQNGESDWVRQVSRSMSGRNSNLSFGTRTEPFIRKVADLMVKK